MKSFSSAEELAQRYPQYASAITAGARSSFLDGADWAYLAGMIAVLGAPRSSSSRSRRRRTSVGCLRSTMPPTVSRPLDRERRLVLGQSVAGEQRAIVGVQDVMQLQVAWLWKGRAAGRPQALAADDNGSKRQAHLVDNTCNK